jgi:hypothetical protein
VSKEPTRWQALQFALKSNLLRLKRWLRDPNGGRHPARMPVCREPSASGPLLAESTSPLYPSDAGAEFALQAGKVQNLRVAARYLHGRELQAGELFSFWAHVPRPTVGRGFARGRELRTGCLIPSVGGGLCQLTNALYDVALQSGCDIVERHAHTQRIPGSMVAEGRDATIFWNYVDLRFRTPVTCQLEIELTASELHVRMRSVGATSLPRPAPGAPLVQLRSPTAPLVESCETCGMESCFRHRAASDKTHHQESSTAWVVDAWMPEHDAYMAQVRGPKDTLLMPLDGRRWRQGSYRWTVNGFAEVVSAPLFVARRSLRMRRLQHGEGAVRQKALLEMDALLAEILAKRIPATALHVVVSQNLAPFLWANGVLAGRTFDVLMTRMPMDALQRQLDRAAALWPGTPTLADFRADPELVAAESAVLANARHWITPHTGIAGCLRATARPSAVLLEWQMPRRGKARRQAGKGTRLYFAGSTLSRKGARELREALQGMDIPLSLGGPLLEGADFWRGYDTKFGGKDWLDEAEAVVLPAWVEHQPRRLLAALAAGIPVICTPACGLPPQSGLTLIPEGDSAALREAIQRTLYGLVSRTGFRGLPV